MTGLDLIMSEQNIYSCILQSKIILEASEKKSNDKWVTMMQEQIDRLVFALATHRSLEKEWRTERSLCGHLATQVVLKDKQIDELKKKVEDLISLI